MINGIVDPDYPTHCHWMEKALELAQGAGNAGEIPVGAVIVNGAGDLLATGQNWKERNQDPTAHAEIIAVRQAAQTLGNWNLKGCTLYVTLEPCPMCAGAIVHSRLSQLIYGVDDPKTGAIRTVLNIPDSRASNHRLSVKSGILETACRQQLQTWFAQKRQG